MKLVRWVEIWIDEPARGAYMLLIRGCDDGTIDIVDPQKCAEIVKEFTGYGDARLWLNEEEYRMVKGRCLFDWD